LYYSNITVGFGNFLLVPYTIAVNHSTAAKLLGINGTYGFQLTVTPVMTVSVSEVQPEDPLRIAVSVSGTGSPLSNALISYCLLTVDLAAGGGAYPSYSTTYGTAYAGDTGSVVLDFPEVDDAGICYAFIAYAELSGLIGVGYHERANSGPQYIIPFIDDLEARRVLIAHSYDVHYFGPPEAELSYNATFVLINEDFTLREMPLGEGNVGKVNYGEGKPYKNVTIPTYNPGILVITYRKSAVEGGVVLMPWGISSLAFPVIFGQSPFGQEWVATDLRQALVNDVAYQTKLALWSLEGYQVIG
jgi:hypothetical protein